jgi:hypothetical protein
VPSLDGLTLLAPDADAAAAIAAAEAMMREPLQATDPIA